jgi:polysaccharide deacetylase family protein (PEP-CTERM system associated)
VRLAPFPPPICLTVDVEDWFHDPGHRYGTDRGIWESLPTRFPFLMRRALDLLDSLGVRATCFFLGWLAQRHPQLVKEAAAAGHEVACHGMFHEILPAMGPQRFLEDLRAAKSVLEDITSCPVTGYRAPRWSVRNAPWAYPILGECGFAYSSSRLPVPGLGGGKVEAEVCAGIIEFPALASPWAPLRLPAGGTLALRVLPVPFLEACRDRVLASGTPAVYWFHPWELDPAPQVLPDMHCLPRCQRYSRLSLLPSRLKRLVGQGRTSTLGEVSALWRTRGA